MAGGVAGPTTADMTISSAARRNCYFLAMIISIIMLLP
jgi:hypothetical protein